MVRGKPEGQGVGRDLRQLTTCSVNPVRTGRTFFMFNAILYALTQPGSIGLQYLAR